MPPRSIGSLVALAAALAVPALAPAHDDVHRRIAAATERIAASPAQAQPYVQRARLYREHLEWDRALADLDRAEALAPERRPQIEYLRGLVLMDAGRPEEAEQALRRSLKGQPGQADALAAHGRALEQLGRHLEAAAELSRAIELAPVPQPAYYVERARALAAAGDAHLEEAVGGLDQGLAALGPVPALRREAIDLEVRRGNLAGALRRIDQAAAESSRSENWLAQRGRLLEAAGRRREALEAFSRALAEIEALPPHRRGTDATRRLDADLRQAVARLAADPAE